MSKNGKTEVKSWKKGEPEDKQTKVNKKRRNEYERSAEEKGLKADDISKAFPNFSVLTQEERLAFFQALTTARKNVEKRGIPARTCFGTVHDEYLKYFCQNEKEKQDENRPIRSSFILGDYSEHVNEKLDQRYPQERKCLSPVLSLQNTLDSSRKNFFPTTIEANYWKFQDSIIQIETDKLIELFLKKKKRNEEKAGSLQSGERYFKSDWRKRNSTASHWIAPRLFKKSDTPKFDALNPEEKEVFFKILQEAHDNVLEKNQNKDCHILPLDAILRRYLGGDEVTTVFATSQDTPSREQTKRDLKVTVTVTSRDNERLLVNQTPERVGPLLPEGTRKYKSENLYPIEMSSDESIEEDNDSTRSEEQMRSGSLSDSGTPEMNTTSKRPSKSTETSIPMKQIKFRANETETNEDNPLKKGDNTEPLEIPKKSQVVTNLSVDSSENLSGGEEGSVQLLDKNSGETVEALETVETAEEERAEGEEGPDSWSIVPSTNEETSDKGLKTGSIVEEGQPKVTTDKNKEDHTEAESEEKAQPMQEDPHPASITVEEEMTEERLGDKEAKAETSVPEKQEGGLVKKVSFLDENLEKSSESTVEESQNEKKNELEDVESSDSKSEVTGKTSVEGAPGAEPRESTLNRVMIVNGDVVGKIKRLIYYLEAKANRDTLLEKEYLKLLVDYADYLSKVLESLIWKKEIQKKQLRNASENTGFRRHCDDSKKKDKLKLQSSESEFLTCSVSVMDVKNNQSPSLPPTKDTVEELKKETEVDLDLPSLSDSESVGSEGETRFKHRKDERDRILTTKIRLLQDLLRHRAEFVEGSFDDLKVIHFPEEKFMPKEKPPTVKLLTEDDEEAENDKKKKFLKSLVTFCTCGKKSKKTLEEGIVENLKGEAVRVDVSGAKKKGAASAILNQSTLEVLKAAERKKIIDKYFLDS